MIAVFAADFSNLHQSLTQYTTAAAAYAGPVAVYLAKVNSNPVLFAQAGATKAELARTMAYIACHYPITHIIGTGNCASLCRNRANIGDVALVAEALEYDGDLSSADDPTDASVDACVDVPAAAAPGTVPLLAADPRLICQGENVLRLLAMPYVTGRMASSDAFVDCDCMAAELRGRFRADFADVECQGMAEYASSNNIPFFAVKGVSNYADSNALHDYESNRRMANEKALRAVMALLEQITG